MNLDISRPLQTVHVIEDDDGLREALSLLLTAAGYNTASFPTPHAFLEQVDGQAKGCLLLDIHLPGMNGLELQEKLNGSESPMPVIMMSGEPDVPTALRSMKAGAIDLLIKPIGQEELLTAVSVAMARDASDRAARTLFHDALSRFESLTRRERQIFNLATTGLMNKQIAFELGISQITVKGHRGTMMSKMGVRSFADLVRVGELLKTRSPGAI